MANSPKMINIADASKKIKVDNKISLSHYDKLSDNLIKEDDIYRQEKNIINLYIVLLRFTSLITETIPYHQDYKCSLQKEKLATRKKVVSVLQELESLKPKVQLLVLELRRSSSQNDHVGVSDQQAHHHVSSDDKFQQTQKLLDEMADLIESLRRIISQSNSLHETYQCLPKTSSCT
ncbi:hypothetical protein J5N97_027832 [Dioscorea zingiberensis]|uniref:USP8 dimerisation domain-containing protein n=1 Tax=Dioscorea zingiberensis TaxID=325984 RepID=A0A9D5BY15_9LILI|nr:hypothetical protein J5N97_027832 [Dioscorea zingiberensis]